MRTWFGALHGFQITLWSFSNSCLRSPESYWCFCVSIGMFVRHKQLLHLSLRGPSDIRWRYGVQSRTRQMSWNANACLWFEVRLDACLYVHRYVRRYIEGVQSGISFSVMTRSGGIPQQPRQNLPSVAAWGTTHFMIALECACGCGVCMQFCLSLH